MDEATHRSWLFWLFFLLAATSYLVNCRTSNGNTICIIGDLSDNRTACDVTFTGPCQPAIENLGPSSGPCQLGAQAFDIRITANFVDNGQVRPHYYFNVFLKTRGLHVNYLGVEFVCLNETGTNHYCNNHQTAPCRLFQPLLTPNDTFTAVVEELGPIAEDTYFNVTVRLITEAENCSMRYGLLLRNAYHFAALHEDKHRVATVSVEAKEPEPQFWMPSLLVSQDLDPYGLWVWILSRHRLVSNSTVVMQLRRGDKVVENAALPPGVVGHRFANIPQGRYTIQVNFEHEKCPRGLCLGKPIDIDVETDHIAPLVIRPRVLRSTLIAVSVIIMVFSIFGLGYAVCRRYRRKQGRALTPLASMPRVMLVYTDDCVEHRQAVLALAHCLSQARCSVLLDEWIFRGRQLPPSADLSVLNDVWREDTYYLIIFSAGSQCYFDPAPNRWLSPMRPWPELFAPILRLIMGRISEGGLPRWSSSSNRFVVTRFSHSQPQVIPRLFLDAGCPSFVLDSDLSGVLRHLHRLGPTDRLRDSWSEGAFQRAVSNAAAKAFEDDYLEDRWTVENPGEVQQPPLPELASGHGDPVDHDMAADSAFPLLLCPNGHPPAAQGQMEEFEIFELPQG